MDPCFISPGEADQAIICFHPCLPSNFFGQEWKVEVGGLVSYKSDIPSVSSDTDAKSGFQVLLRSFLR